MKTRKKNLPRKFHKPKLVSDSRKCEYRFKLRWLPFNRPVDEMNDLQAAVFSVVTAMACDDTKDRFFWIKEARRQINGAQKAMRLVTKAGA